MTHQSEELVHLTIVPNELEAEMIRALLESAGIASMHRPTDFAAGAFGGMPGPQREIVVRATDLERARELIDSK